MSNKNGNYYRTILAKRQGLAFDRLRADPSYIVLCDEESKAEQAVNSLLHDRLSKEDIETVSRRHDFELDKQILENDEIYIQGLQDSVALLAFLGVFKSIEVQL